MKNTIEDYIRRNEDFRQILLKQEGGIMKYLAEYLPEHPETYVDNELLAKYREQYYKSFLKDNRGNYDVTFLEENEKKRKSFGYIHLSKELEYQIALTPVLIRLSKEIAEDVRNFIYKYMVFAWKENRRLYYPDGTPPDILYWEIINLYSFGGKAYVCMDYLLREHHNPQVWAKKKNIDSLYDEFLIQQYSDFIFKDDVYKKLRQAVKDMTEGRTEDECRQICITAMMAVKNFSRMIYSTSKVSISDCTGDYVADKEWLHNIAKEGVLRSINHKKDSLYSCFSSFVLLLNEIGRIWAARMLVNGIDMHELEKETGCIMFPVSEPTEWPDGRDHGNYRYYVDKDVYKLDNGYCIGNEEKAKELLDNLMEKKQKQKISKGSNNRECLAIRLKDSIMEFTDKVNNNPESITILDTFIVKSKFDMSLMKAIICGLSEKWLMDKAIQVISDTWDEHVSRRDEICYKREGMLIMLKYFSLEQDLKDIRDRELERRDVDAKFKKMVTPNVEKEVKPRKLRMTVDTNTATHSFKLQLKDVSEQDRRKRIMTFFADLSSNSKYISEKTDAKDFFDNFGGIHTAKKIVWTAEFKQLLYLITILKKAGVLTWNTEKPKPGIRQMICIVFQILEKEYKEVDGKIDKEAVPTISNIDVSRLNTAIDKSDEGLDPIIRRLLHGETSIEEGLSDLVNTEGESRYSDK